MKFFEHQDRARQNTQRLVVIYILSIVSIIFTVYGAALLTSGFLGTKSASRSYYSSSQTSIGYRSYRLSSRRGRFTFRSMPTISTAVPTRSNLTPNAATFSWWQPQLFWLSVTSTALVIGGGSWYKLMLLKQGGTTIAQQLGGRILLPETAVLPEEKQLLNVVEEMAIAANIPVPFVYILGGEQSINAFAAGYTPNDAVIGVTRGCLEQLTRDELQGVIGHEFSHILNGDMRLNIKLVAALHGILMVYVSGRIFLRASSYSDRYRSFNLVFGLLLISIGLLGHFWGRILQSAISRQREFLADASATQFT